VSGGESASLYWNWAQAAAARGAQGEALWALLRARELDPGDRAVVRDVERLRESLNLDSAEIAPEPLAAAGRVSRRFRLDLVALALLALSLVAPSPRFGRAAGPVALGRPLLGNLRQSPDGGSARSTAVARRGAASDSASPGGSDGPREGEVVPVLEASGTARVEDNAGAAGHTPRRRRVDTPPLPPRTEPRALSRPSNVLNDEALYLRPRSGSSANLHATESRPTARCRQGKIGGAMADSLALHVVGAPRRQA
jgi:hypothetical protein